MKDKTKILNTRMHRTVDIQRADDTETGLVLELAASSDIPYQRSFGYETLQHTDKSIDFTRVPAGSCPLLYNHQTDNYIGIVESVRVDTGQLRAVVRLSKNSDFARQVAADITDGILKSISIGYEIDEMVVGPDIREIPQYIATKWTLYEISVVTTPADYMGAGIGREAELLKEIYTSPEHMTDEDNQDEAAAAEEEAEAEEEKEHEEYKMDSVENILEMINNLAPDEMQLLEDALAQDAEEMEPAKPADEAVEEDGEEEAEVTDEEDDEDDEDAEVTEEDIDAILEDLSKSLTIVKKEPYNVVVPAPKATHSLTFLKGESKMSNTAAGSEKIGADNTNTLRLVELANKYDRTADLSKWINENRTAADVALDILETKSNVTKIGAPAIHIKDSSKYEFGTAVKAWLQGSNSELSERGIDQARAAGRSVNSQTLYIPTDVEMIKSSRFMKRDGTAFSNSGVNAVGKEFLSWEETLREGALLARVGGQVLALNDIASAPYFSTATSGSVPFETGSVADSSVVVATKAWSPKRLAARYIYSNLLGKLNGTYDFASELTTDLLAEGVRLFDSQCWGGTGTEQMTGLFKDTSVTAINTSGSFSLASGSLMITTVAAANADVSKGSFVLAHNVYSQVYSTAAFTNAGLSILGVLEATNPVYRTGYIPLTGTKGGAMFGDWSKTTAATFGPIEIRRDDITKAQTGQTCLTFETFADCVARQPAALVIWNNITL